MVGLRVGKIVVGDFEDDHVGAVGKILGIAGCTEVGSTGVVVYVHCLNRRGRWTIGVDQRRRRGVKCFVLAFE